SRHSSLLPRPPPSLLFPYTTLFRSPEDGVPPISFLARFFFRFLPEPALPAGVAREPEPTPPPTTILAHSPFVDITAVAPLTRCLDRKSTRLNSSHGSISYAVFCLKK